MIKHIILNENDKNKTISELLKEHGIIEYKKVFFNKFNLIVEV